MANVANHEEQLVIERVPIGDLRPDPNTTRELCFMTRSRPRPAEEIGGRGARNLEDLSRRPVAAAACVRRQIRPGGYAA